MGAWVESGWWWGGRAYVGVVGLHAFFLQYSSTLGMPDSIYTWRDIVSHTCHPLHAFLVSKNGPACPWPKTPIWPLLTYTDLNYTMLLLTVNTFFENANWRNHSKQIRNKNRPLLSLLSYVGTSERWCSRSCDLAQPWLLLYLGALKTFQNLVQFRF